MSKRRKLLKIEIKDLNKKVTKLDDVIGKQADNITHLEHVIDQQAESVTHLEKENNDLMNQVAALKQAAKVRLQPNRTPYEDKWFPLSMNKLEHKYDGLIDDSMKLQTSHSRKNIFVNASGALGLFNYIINGEQKQVVREIKCAVGKLDEKPDASLADLEEVMKEVRHNPLEIGDSDRYNFWSDVVKEEEQNICLVCFELKKQGEKRTTYYSFGVYLPDKKLYLGCTDLRSKTVAVKVGQSAFKNKDKKENWYCERLAKNLDKQTIFRYRKAWVVS